MNKRKTIDNMKKIFAVCLLSLVHNFAIADTAKYVMYGNWFESISETNVINKSIFEAEILPKLISSGGGDVEKNIAMFIIPVNYSTDGNFTDFELKATTMNFSHDTNEYERLIFYSQSEFADVGVSLDESQDNPNKSLDKMYLFVCTSHYMTGGLYSGDTRGYYYIKNTGSDWLYDLTMVVVLIDVDCLKRHPYGNWLSNKNDELIWSYTRYIQNTSETKYEKEKGTQSVLWRPIVPVKWFKEMPQWAEDQLQQN